MAKSVDDYRRTVNALLAACKEADDQDPPWLKGQGHAGLTTTRIRRIIGEHLEEA